MVANVDSVFQNLDQRTPVELLMVGCSPNQANECAIALRNAGQAVHVESAEAPGELAQMLETEPGDLVIVNADSKVLDKEHAIEAVRETNPSASIILMSGEAQKLVSFAADMELRDVVPPDDTERLSFAIRREHQTLLLRQQLARLRHQLRESEDRFDNLMGKSRDAIAYVHEGMHIHANNVYCHMFGITDTDDIEGMPLMDLIEKGSRKDFKKILRRHEEDKSFNSGVTCQGIDGHTFTVTMEFSPAEVDGEPCTQIMVRDQSLHQELQARIDELTNRDSHTHLFNRHAFMERLEGVLNQTPTPDNAGLVQISINNFSELRDSTGIEKSDQLLKDTAKILQQAAGGAHTIARFGDHDFVILNADGTPLTTTAEQCLSALRNHDFKQSCGIQAEPDFSLGVTALPDNERISTHELIDRSCRATKHAEQDHASRLVVFDEAHHLDAPAKEADSGMVELIDHALENDRFRLVYQPIVSLQGDTRENYSVLVRMLNQKDEERLPETFWSDARIANRLAEIDRWVVRNAIMELVKHRQEGKKINFHILLSADGIKDESMLLWVCDCLREFKAKGAWLTFHFNENHLRDLIKPALALMEGLKKINCRTAISHYSDSASSAPLLQHLPVDIVKLSPEFITNLARNPQSQEKLAEVNQRLQEEKFKTIASGVEDANSLAILWNIGVNYIQGYFLQEPSSSISFDDE